MEFTFDKVVDEHEKVLEYMYNSLVVAITRLSNTKEYKNDAITITYSFSIGIRKLEAELFYIHKDDFIVNLHRELETLDPKTPYAKLLKKSKEIWMETAIERMVNVYNMVNKDMKGVYLYD